MEPVRELLPQGQLLLPLPGAVHAGARLVKEGSTVTKYEPLTCPQTHAPVNSPVNGTIRELRPITHPLLGETVCAVLEPETAKKGRAGKLRLEEGVDTSVPEGILAVAQAAGIVDEYDGVPLYHKLKRFHRFGRDLLCGVILDEETYVCGSEAAFREAPEELAAGLELAAKACGAEEWRIAVASLKRLQGVDWVREHREKMEEAGLVYPSWAMLEKRLRAAGKTPERIGAQACIALYRAVKKGTPQVKTVVTVAGEQVKQPANLRVMIGTPLRELLDECGCLPESRIFVGSPMTGKLVEDLELPVTADTRCVIASPHTREIHTYACIGCGRCAAVCPEKILPWYLYENLQRGGYTDPEQLLRAQNCRGCNSCSAVCPSGISLGKAVRTAAEVRERSGWE